MKSREALIERLRTNPVHASDEAHEESDRAYVYVVLNLCLPENTQTRSDYVVGEQSGYYRENSCGRKASGKLAFAAEVTIEDEDFGSIAGWIYNSSAKPACSYFFSSEPPFPEFPDMHFVCRGKPYKPGDPVEYDLWDGWGANRL